MEKIMECPSMFRVNDGKRNARIIGSESILDQAMKTGAINQLLNISELPGIVDLPVGMPDIHQGYGFPVGAVAAFRAEDGIVSPGGVGYDINCGVTLMSTGMEIRELKGKTKEIMDSVWENVPVGMKKSRFKPTTDDMSQILEIGLGWAVDNGMATEDDQNMTEHSGTMKSAKWADVSQLAQDRGKNDLGTLGSGNHFMEFQYIDSTFEPELASKFRLEKGMAYVMIHSGSRGLGHQVAVDYIEKVKKEYPEQKVPDEQLRYAPLGSESAVSYISAMNAAANYGFVNRQVMIHRIRQALGKVFKNTFDPVNARLVYSISHNMAKFENDLHGEKILVHRKGATAAHGPGRASGYYRETGHPVIIPGSMGARSYIMVGSQSEKDISFSSSCHGAGRSMSRKMAKETINHMKVIENLEKKGISIKSDSEYSISEEAPESYKDIEEVKESMINSGISRPVASMFPIFVLKG